jgi:hypothetical protein
MLVHCWDGVSRLPGGKWILPGANRDGNVDRASPSGFGNSERKVRSVKKFLSMLILAAFLMVTTGCSSTPTTPQAKTPETPPVKKDTGS